MEFGEIHDVVQTITGVVLTGLNYENLYYNGLWNITEQKTYSNVFGLKLTTNDDKRMKHKRVGVIEVIQFELVESSTGDMTVTEYIDYYNEQSKLSTIAKLKQIITDLEKELREKRQMLNELESNTL